MLEIQRTRDRNKRRTWKLYVAQVVDVDLARANPALAVLSVLCHGGHAAVDTMFPALMEALRTLVPSKAISYYDVVLAGLPVASRARWEEFMTTTVGREYRSELLRERILGCADLTQLEAWLRRAVTVATAEDVVAD